MLFISYPNNIILLDDTTARKGEIVHASGFNSPGGGIQYQLPLPIDLEEIGYLKTIKNGD